MRHKRLIARVLIAIELMLCAGIVYVSSAGASQLRETDIRWQVFQFDIVSAEADSEHRLTVNRSSALIVGNPSGQVAVTGGAGKEIVVTAHKKAWGSSQPDAEAALASLKVNVTQDAGTVMVKVETPPVMGIVASAHSPTADLTITVPITTAVTTRVGFGSVTLSGTTSDADLQTNFGTVRVTDVSGNLKLRSNFGKITVERVAAGTVEAHSNSGTVGLTKVEAGGTVNLSSNFGAVTFENGRADSLTAKTNSGKITLTRIAVRGMLMARSGFGAVSDPTLFFAIPCLGFLGFFVLLFGFIAFMRYLSYRGTLALAEKGLVRPEPARGNGKDTLRWGIVITALGIALGIGIYPIGFFADLGNRFPLHFGPWMMLGLIPTFFGLALILIYVLTREEKPKDETGKTD